MTTIIWNCMKRFCRAGSDGHNTLIQMPRIFWNGCLLLICQNVTVTWRMEQTISRIIDGLLVSTSIDFWPARSELLIYRRSGAMVTPVISIDIQKPKNNTVSLVRRTRIAISSQTFKKETILKENWTLSLGCFSAESLLNHVLHLPLKKKAFFLFIFLRWVMLNALLQSATRPSELKALFWYKFAPKSENIRRHYENLTKDETKRRCYDFLNMVRVLSVFPL